MKRLLKDEYAFFYDFFLCLIVDNPLVSSSPVTLGSSFDESSNSDIAEKSKGSEQEQRPEEAFDPNSTTDTQYSRSDKKSKLKTPISTPQPQPRSSPEYEAIIYIPDLPAEIEDNIQLEQTIRQRLSKVFNIEPIDVKCYSNFGIGRLRVANDQIKEHLVNVACKMAWTSSQESVMISFRNTIEFESYIVFERMKGNKDIDFPKSDEIVRRWIDAYNGERPFVCEQLNIQYPNIYRIVSKSINELLRVASKPDLIIKSQRAHVYLCADCSFFEDLPISTTENELRDLICNTIRSTKISLSSLYIQLNNSMNNACILATDTARKWTNKDSIYIGSEFIRKNKSLSYRLLLRPVHQKDEAEAIIRHEIFAGKAKIINHFGQNLILKLHEKNIYDKCQNSNTLRIGKGISVNMEIYTGTPDPNKREIGVDTWYDEEMLKCESNIMPFIQQPEHKIFQLQWNAQLWLEQFERVRTLEKQKQGPVWANEMRHRLRVTVMLNTLAALRKKGYMIDDDDIQLNLNRKITTIVYNHQSKLQFSGSMSIKKTPFKTTEVKVVNEDCLVVYENLVNQGRKPLLLNMASATSPGGGYRKGDGAQEENIFRRSDYFRSLDIGLDTFEQPFERFYCTSTCNLNLLANLYTMYPMDEYGAIYTAGLTVFRRPEMDGYEFMKKPLTDVCALAMAAYRHPPLDGNMLSPKYAVGMRKKIENIFAIAYYNQHDSLVLSALGCGAFKNPPEHVAKIFRSVIEQYAGFFRLIVFAIIDDHNTGLNLNPKGNFLPFQREFEQSIFEPIQPIYQTNTIFGPYRFLSNGSTVSDVSICDLTPCNFGAKCRDLHDSIHTRQYCHPPLCTEACVTGTCTKMDDIVHMYSFIHQNLCPHGGQCRDIDNIKHAREFEHPSYCPAGNNCQDMSDDHEKEYRHLPLCKDAHKCEDYRRRVRHHCDAYRHCKPSCQYGRYCVYFHDKQHMNDYQHPFPSPCPWTPYHCVLYDEFRQVSSIEKLPQHVQQHCVDFAHVCQFGRNCLEQNSLHWKTTTHVPRSVCSAGKECLKLNQEDHLNSFTHSNVQDIRYLCKNGSTCEDNDKAEHKAQYRHEIIGDTNSIVPYFDLNKNINFFVNQQEHIECIMNYIKHNQWTSFTSNSVPENILDWIRTVQPIHQCKSEVFKLILLCESVISYQQMEYFKKPKFAAHHILQNNRIKSINNLKTDPCTKHARSYITALITDIYFKQEFLKIDSNDQQSSTNYDDIICQERDSLLKYISQDDIKLIHDITIEIARASTKISFNSLGISCSSDVKWETNKHVLSILGPYLDNKDDDIILVFKREILHHPDANFSIQASSSYRSGRCYQCQPWLGLISMSEEERIKLFHNTKLHASIPGYEQAAAIELIALTSHDLSQRTMNIDLDIIFRCWLSAHSQNAIEARLPQLIPLDYIDQIYMMQNTYESFDIDIRQGIQTIFGCRLTILSSKSNEEYHNYVNNALFQKFNKHDIQTIPRPIQGFVITIPPTNFIDNLVLPLKLSQAYEYYCINHSKASKDMTMYIYWQVMNGDMMLTLSNEQIHENELQSKTRCLICYIAEKPIVTNNQYIEYPSYLNLGQPSQHQTFIKENRYAVKSTSFYLGCNLDDFMTFCLKIQPSNGTVKLTHVGSNSIYNHEIISYVFPRSDIDLSKIEFIHISAGIRIVSIRNLFVTFEKQNDMYPTIDIKCDKSFSSGKKLANDARRDRSPCKHHASSFVVTDDRAKQSGGVIDRVKNKTTQPIDQTLDYFNDRKKPKLIPCRHGINCLTQFSADGSTHNSTYSHPCRFAELCRNHEPHLTHEPRQVPGCHLDKKCQLLSNTRHRAKYRHSDLPYFLIPCRFQSQCKDNTEKHRIKYSHGEQVLETFEKSPSKGKKQIIENRHFVFFMSLFHRIIQGIITI